MFISMSKICFLSHLSLRMSKEGPQQNHQLYMIPRVSWPFPPGPILPSEVWGSETAIARISGEVKNVHQRFDAVAEAAR